MRAPFNTAAAGPPPSVGIAALDARAKLLAFLMLSASLWCVQRVELLAALLLLTLGAALVVDGSPVRLLRRLAMFCGGFLLPLSLFHLLLTPGRSLPHFPWGGLNATYEGADQAVRMGLQILALLLLSLLLARTTPPDRVFAALTWFLGPLARRVCAVSEGLFVLALTIRLLPPLVRISRSLPPAISSGPTGQTGQTGDAEGGMMARIGGFAAESVRWAWNEAGTMTEGKALAGQAPLGRFRSVEWATLGGAGLLAGLLYGVG
ncbi:MAG: hypothetical protein HZA23_01995 [Nitrospirae bacterium]|nr:hypothetical protein [Nitrospirota bacterium]